MSALLAAAGIGALAASFAGGDPRAAGGLAVDDDRRLGRLAVEPVERPAAQQPLRAKTGQKLDWFQTPEPFEIAPQTEEGATLPCPKGYRAVTGYYVTGEPGTFVDLTAPEVAVPPSTEPDQEGEKASKRNWVIAVFNSTATTDQVLFGVGCLNKLK